MDYFRDEEKFKEKCGYDIDGTWFPRVTKILDIKSKPALYFYYGEAASYKAAQAITKKSAEEGTAIHEAAEKIFIGEDPEVDPSIKPSIDAFKEFLMRSNMQVAPEYVERRAVNHNHRYAGTIDAMALIGGKFGVLDIKTSQAVYRDYNLQTAAYMDALMKEFPNLQTRWILRIDQTRSCMRCGGSMRSKGGRDKIRRGAAVLCSQDEHEWSEVKGVVELKEFPYWRDDFKAFLSAKGLWEWENDYWLKKINYY